MEITWAELFQIGFKEAKINIQERYPLEEDGSGESRRVAFRQISEQLPFAVKVLELEIDRPKKSATSTTYHKIRNLSIRITQT